MRVVCILTINIISQIFLILFLAETRLSIYFCAGSAVHCVNFFLIFIDSQFYSLLVRKEDRIIELIKKVLFS